MLYNNNVIGSPLALAKVMYLANINNYLSLVSIPLGARCHDFEVGSNSARGRCLSSFSSSVPLLFSQYHSCGVGLIVRGSNIAVSFAELVSELEMQPDSAGSHSWFGTFCQVNYQPYEEARVTLSGLWKIPRSPSSHLFKLGTLAIPVGRLKPQTSPDSQLKASSVSPGSISVMLESEFDESTTIGGWVEMQKLNPNLFQWGFSLADTPEDELGWGLRLGGKVEGHLKQFQLEGFLNFNFGNRVNLQPGFLYATDGRTRNPALVLRSSWSM